MNLDNNYMMDEELVLKDRCVIINNNNNDYNYNLQQETQLPLLMMTTRITVES